MRFKEIAHFIGTKASADLSPYTQMLFSGKFLNVSNFVTTSLKQTAWYIARYISNSETKVNRCSPENANIA